MPFRPDSAATRALASPPPRSPPPLTPFSTNSHCSDAMARHRQQLEERGDDPSDTAAPVMWHGSEAEATEVMVYHTAILRNKRLLMAYM